MEDRDNRNSSSLLSNRLEGSGRTGESNGEGSGSTLCTASELRRRQHEIQEDKVAVIAVRSSKRERVENGSDDHGASSSTSGLYRERSYSFPNNVSQLRTWKSKWDEDDEDYVVDQVAPSKFLERLLFVGLVAAVCSAAVLVVCGFFLYLSLMNVERPDACDNKKLVLNFTAQRIRLKGGRYVSFSEQGVGADRARHSVLVVHDIFSSRLAGIPGINSSLLDEFGVRLVAYDRPGYGQSDPLPGRNYSSCAMDMVDIADALGMHEKFWVLGYGGGGPYVWAAIKYIPEKLAGAVMFAPAGNPYLQSMTKDEAEEIWGVWTLRQKWMYKIAHSFPALLPSLLQRTVGSSSTLWLQYVRTISGLKDKALMNYANFSATWEADVKEALHQGCAFPIAEELIMLVSNWGFSIGDFPLRSKEPQSFLQQVLNFFRGKDESKVFSGPIHIWQGTEDQIVPAAVNVHAKRLVDGNYFRKRLVSPLEVHVLEGEGHYSWFWFCEKCHRQVFKILFGVPEKRRARSTRTALVERTSDLTALVSLNRLETTSIQHEAEDERADLCSILCQPDGK